MNALVGRLAPGGRWFRARPVELEGQPSWTLAQMRAMWDRRFQRNTDRMVTTLLRRDWSVLAATEWPASVTEHNPHEWRYVSGVGRGLHHWQCGRALVAGIAAPPPVDDAWAYLWEQELGALHVYAARGGRWHHLATLPADVWAEMTEQLVVDVEARWCWLARGEEKVA
ncbi:hypothetical protein JMF97_28725 [Micromonospora fiedleri]|uniref:DUF4132 domain-containing protein n=1 Tax=Micromonospora fiedleri TaxID=1157498 RepID=A0ABS1UUZ7_9ACTN|nr:hypothetical protein [Micromonospora fiedleri]MBL6280153.1 hypothetical protein [Micromonospora fiedleri]